MSETLRPAELAQLKIIECILDMVGKTGDCNAPVLFGLIAQYVAAMFMKRPELMYAIFSDLDTLDSTDWWLDQELDEIEKIYENSN